VQGRQTFGGWSSQSQPSAEQYAKIWISPNGPDILAEANYYHIYKGITDSGWFGNGSYVYNVTGTNVNPPGGTSWMMWSGTWPGESDPDAGAYFGNVLTQFAASAPSSISHSYTITKNEAAGTYNVVVTSRVASRGKFSSITSIEQRYASGTSAGGTYTTIFSGSSTSEPLSATRTVNGLAANTNYTFQTRVTNSAGLTATSGAFTFKTPENPPPAPVVPNVPQYGLLKIYDGTSPANNYRTLASNATFIFTSAPDENIAEIGDTLSIKSDSDVTPNVPIYGVVTAKTGGTTTTYTVSPFALGLFPTATSSTTTMRVYSPRYSQTTFPGSRLTFTTISLPDRMDTIGINGLVYNHSDQRYLRFVSRGLWHSTVLPTGYKWVEVGDNLKDKLIFAVYYPSWSTSSDDFLVQTSSGAGILRPANSTTVHLRDTYYNRDVNIGVNDINDIPVVMFTDPGNAGRNYTVTYIKPGAENYFAMKT
jgi:hypothetical protein